jgi:hypothetical protein
VLFAEIVGVLIHTQGHVQRKGKPVIIVENRIISLLVSRGKQKQTRSPRHSNKKHVQRNLKTLDTGSNSSSDKDYLYTMTNTKHNNKVNVTVGSAKFQTTIDSGTTINVIDHDTFNKMQDIKLTRTNNKAFTYNTKSPVEFLGKFEAVIETQKQISVATFHVAKAVNCGNLLSLSTAQELGLITLHPDKLTSKDINFPKYTIKGHKIPQIHNQVKNTIAKCTTCQAVGQANPPEQLRMTEMPELPWRTVHIDFYGPLPSSEYLLVAVDRYSRFPEVEIVHSTRASKVIPKLDKMFSVHGIPDTIISDNSPPFNGDEYARYLKALGIQAKFSTPYWRLPQGNATVERFM